MLRHTTPHPLRAGRGVRENAERPGRRPAVGPESNGPEDRKGGCGGPAQYAAGQLASGAKHHGGQPTAPGIMGSRTLGSCRNRVFAVYAVFAIFAGGAIGPDTALAARKATGRARNATQLYPKAVSGPWRVPDSPPRRPHKATAPPRLRIEAIRPRGVN